MVCVFCFRTGVIGFRENPADIPRGSITIAVGESEALKHKVSACARHDYDGVTLLVPGVPEADTDQEAYDALVRWTRWAFPVQPEAGEAL